MKSAAVDLDVWVLAGQSNMQGCAWLRGALAPDPRVFVFSSAGAWEPAAEPLHRLWESFTPVHQEMMRPGLPPADRDASDAELARREARERIVGAGLGMSFGIAMADALGRRIGLVAAAHGGTTLEQWSPALKDRGGHSLYGAMLERVSRAGGRLRGVLWYQGESDARLAEDARTYADRFDGWIAAVRSDTGCPDLPVIAVQLGRVFPAGEAAREFPYWDLVREAQRILPERTQGTGVTTAVDLPLVDGIHVNTAGLVRLGRRMARHALRLGGESGIAPGPFVTGIETWTTPGGGSNALRIRFGGVTGGWRRTDGIRGFTMHAAEGSGEAPPFPIDAWVDAGAGDDSVILLLSRLPARGEKVGYGLGMDPVCDLVDGADMSLCSFMPR
jgi:sialate O-acetylesterase